MSLFQNYSVAGLPVSVTRKRVKNLSLRFAKDGRSLSLTVPYFASDNNIRDMLLKSEPWVRKNMSGVQEKASAEVKPFVTGDTIWLWGRGYTAELINSDGFGIVLRGDTALFYAPADSETQQRKAFLREWYRARLYEKAPGYLSKLSEMTGLVPSDWSVKAMKTRWGTCNCKTGKIWLSLYLAQKDECCLEYVILHELCHLKYHDHGDGFKTLLGHYMSDWKERKKLLNAVPTDPV